MHAKLPQASRSYAIEEKKKSNFNILGSRGKSLEKFTFDLDVPKSIMLGGDEKQ